MKHLCAGEIIRSKRTGLAWIVLHIYKHGWLVADLADGQNPTNIKAILPRSFDEWVRDVEVTNEQIEEVQRPSMGPMIEYGYRVDIVY